MAKRKTARSRSRGSARKARSVPKTPRAKRKIHKVMGEFKDKTLKSGSGRKVTKRKQAVAIALSEARKKK